MRKILRMIIFISYHVVTGMVAFDGNTHLGCSKNLLKGLIPSGLKINKRPAFESVTDEFESRWNSVLYDAEKHLVKLLLKESKNVVAKVQSEIELEILDSETTYGVTLGRLEQKHAKFQQNLEKRRDKKCKKFQQNDIKERRAWKSYADIGYGKKTKLESISNESKLKQRATVERKENSVDMRKRNGDRPIFAEIVSNKNITDNRKFRKKRNKTYTEAVGSAGTSTSGEKVLEPLKARNVLKEENHDFNRTAGKDLESIYASLMAQIHYILYLDFARTLLPFKIHLGIETCLQILKEMIMRS